MQGYYWLEMAQDASEIQKACLQCQKPLDVDWTKLYLNFLLHEVLPSNHYKATKIKKKDERFFVEEDQLLQKGFNQAPLRCLARD